MPINISLSQVMPVNKKQSITNNKTFNIKVSNLGTPSLGSIGVKTKINDIMRLDIWQDMSASEIVKQLNYIPDLVSSKALQSLLIDLYLSTSNPPRGNSDDIIKFLETRLIKIKSSGQSEKLYQLIKQLPKGQRWKIWKRWSIEYELLTHRDKIACEYINKEAKNNNNYFWQKTRIFCLSINDKLNESEFILDLIKSKGFSDIIFENLFKIMNGDKTDFQFDKTDFKIQPIHIIMMDTLKIPIKANFIAGLGIEYTKSLLTLTYLTPKARSFLLDKKMNYNHVSSKQIIENYKSVSNEPSNIEKAFSIYTKNPNGYSRAKVWMSIISLKDDIKKVEAIFKVLKSEMKYGRFYHSINLYLPVLEKINSSSLTKKLNASIKKLKIVANPSLFPDESLANILMLKKGKEWNWNIILKEKAWSLIPVLEEAGMLEPKSFNWLNIANQYNQEALQETKYNKWSNNYNLNSFLLIKSIEKASNSNKKALTLLLLGRLVGNNPFIDFDVSQLLIIRKSLFNLGFEDLANNLTLEVMTSKLITF
ncbi:MAG: hypothetical protein ACKVHI_03955 [Candidatus Puniceispirillales bacterium]